MDARIEKRRAFIINVIYFGIFAALVYFLYKHAFWVLFPFILAFFIAVCLQGAIDAIVGKTKIKRGAVSVALSLLVYIVIGAVVARIGLRVADEIRSFVSYVIGQMGTLTEMLEDLKLWLISVVSSMPERLSSWLLPHIEEWDVGAISISDAASSVGSVFGAVFSSPVSSALSTVKQIPSLLVGVLVAIISTCFITSDYHVITAFVKRQLGPGRGEKLSRAKKLIMSSLGKLVRSYLIIMAVTFTEVALTLVILKALGFYTAGYIVVISAATAVVDIVPVLGTGTVLIPWAVYSLFTGSTGLGVGLLVAYAIITVIRQVVEPKIVAGQFDLPPFLTIMSMYIGIKLFGAIGIFLLPITVIMIKILNDEGIIHLFRTKKTEEAKAAAAAETPDIPELPEKAEETESDAAPGSVPSEGDTDG